MSDADEVDKLPAAGADMVARGDSDAAIASDEDACAVAKPTMADAMTDFEKIMAGDCDVRSELSVCISLREWAGDWRSTRRSWTSQVLEVETP